MQHCHIAAALTIPHKLLLIQNFVGREFAKSQSGKKKKHRVAILLKPIYMLQSSPEDRYFLQQEM
jgi:hypothetical protein